jgi:hypothetical protein
MKITHTHTHTHAHTHPKLAVDASVETFFKHCVYEMHIRIRNTYRCRKFRIPLRVGWPGFFIK